MRLDILQITLLACTLGLSFRVGATTQQEAFQMTCVKSWMQRMGENQDKTDYKNFGEKYCDCASKQPLDSTMHINKTMQLCMSQTLLQDTMDTLENEVGLDKATEEDLHEYCEDRFALVFPKMSERDRQISAAYCDCAKPHLLKILRTANDMTDKEYSNHINEVAAICSTGLENDASTAVVQ
jgi:hypothetical protein